MDTDESEDTFMRGFGALPAWQKAAVVVTGVMIAPLAIFVGLITGLSLLPIALFGRFEGSLGKAPLERDLAHATRSVQRHTEEYYAH